jgi:hypothetical protein
VHMNCLPGPGIISKLTTGYADRLVQKSGPCRSGFYCELGALVPVPCPPGLYTF